MSLLDSRQMEGMPPEEQAQRAIRHALTRIRDDKDVWFFMGYGTESFGLLTEALAALEGSNVQNVRERFFRPSDEKEAVCTLSRMAEACRKLLRRGRYLSGATLELCWRILGGVDIEDDEETLRIILQNHPEARIAL